MLLLPTNLIEAHCHISNHPHHQALNQQYGWNFSLAGWFPQRVVSKSLFGGNGVKTIQSCEAHYGIFVWATEFSNVHTTFSYSPNPIVIDGETYANSEAYFQCQKSFGMSDHQQAKAAIQHASPIDAYTLARNFGQRPDWFEVNVAVMRKAVYAKFTQNSDLRALLLSTGDYPLVQVKPGDHFWGTGPNHNGVNRLGVLLMDLRKQLRASSFGWNTGGAVHI